MDKVFKCNQTFTSYFAIAGNHPKALSIALYPPKWYRGEEFKLLAPLPFMLKLDEEEYREAYYREILSKLNPEKIEEIISGRILLCYEKPSEFCHRRLVAEWIEQETGLFVPELKPKSNQISLF